MTFSEAGRYNFASAIAVRIAALSESRMLSRRFCFEGAMLSMLVSRKKAPNGAIEYKLHSIVVDSQTILRHGKRNTHHNIPLPKYEAVTSLDIHVFISFHLGFNEFIR